MRHLLIPALVLATGLAACSGSSEATKTDAPVTAPEPQPEPTPPPPAEEPPPADEPAPQPEPQPEQANKKPTRYTGRTVVATKVERKSIRCKGANAGATLDDNRRACAQELASQVSEPDQLIAVIDEQPGMGCPTCVTMMAEVSPVASDPPGQVLFLKETAGEVECQGGRPEATLEQTRTECYATLQQEGGSLRAAVVLPQAIEEGKPCKSCISIVGTGYTATVLQ